MNSCLCSTGKNASLRPAGASDTESIPERDGEKKERGHKTAELIPTAFAGPDTFPRLATHSWRPRRVKK